MKTITENEYFKLGTEGRKVFTGIVKWDDGTIQYWQKGLIHRVQGPNEGPQFESLNGHKEWCINGKHHRLDGPARILPDGTEEYWIHGIQCTKVQYQQTIDLLEYKKI